MGVIKTKISATYASIYLMGVLDVTVGIRQALSQLYRHFTNVPPTSDYSQILGYSYGNGKIYFEPSLSVIKLNP